MRCREGHNTSRSRIAFRLALKCLRFAFVFLAVLEAVSSRAQMIPATLPTITSAPSGILFNRFTATNWNPGRVPTTTDDVGIGSSGIGQIIGQQTVARTVTLGVAASGTTPYSPGELQVSGSGGVLNISPPGTTNPGLQLLSGSTLQVMNGGVVNINLSGSAIDNFGTINIGTGEAGGTINATTIRNENGGNIDFNLTDTTTLSANIITQVSAAGTITKEGSGTAVLNGGISSGSSLSISGGTVVLGNVGTFNTLAFVNGSSSVLKIAGGTTNTSFPSILLAT
jgi:fibronectin-binding autotransporter adhesin